MLKTVLLSALISLPLSNAAFAQSEPPDLTAQSIPFLNGQSLGVYFSQHMEESEKEAFLKGFDKGFASHSFTQEELSTFQASKKTWFENLNVNQSPKASYSAGYLAAQTPLFAQSGIEINHYFQGFIDTLNDPKLSYLDSDKAKQITTAFQKQNRIKQKKNILTKNIENIKNGQSFLELNATKDGVVKMTSGLQYKIIKAGTGAKPQPNNSVILKVVGKKLNGDLFYDSDTLDKPFKIKVLSSIAAWREALPLMELGAVWELYTPSQLAYEQYGFKDLVEPGEALIYTLELKAIE